RAFAYWRVADLNSASLPAMRQIRSPATLAPAPSTASRAAIPHHPPPVSRPAPSIPCAQRVLPLPSLPSPPKKLSPRRTLPSRESVLHRLPLPFQPTRALTQSLVRVAQASLRLPPIVYLPPPSPPSLS